MYLKALDLTGFKSFGERTKLEFERGTTAIVGPNGCGKSNIADAIRWVLGEQSAKQLRGTRMEDCIFNGTDARKPLGMAEVSLTLGDCDGLLDAEFDEITVTRRVFRTGEGQYFINKAPCRLKDIQRLFMGTGIGTSSYSLMEQGNIDQVLSSRPEDRRAIFEEASGITKYKADKKEAIRKLEHTEHNLERIADVIREVKSQIISLQRQAGKARRYKAMQASLRGIDIFATRRKLRQFSDRLAVLEKELRGLNAQIAEGESGLQALQEDNASLRSALSQTEREMQRLMETSVNVRTQLHRTENTIQTNTERVGELQRLSERDAAEIERARGNIDGHRRGLAELAERLERGRVEMEGAERELNAHVSQLDAQEQAIRDTNQTLHDLHEESVEMESLDSHLQNELMRLESQNRAATVRREHLMAERTQLAHGVEGYEKRQSEMGARLAELEAQVVEQEQTAASAAAQITANDDQIEQVRQAISTLQEQAAAARAQLELLQESEQQAEGYPEGARQILAAAAGTGPRAIAVDPATVLGPLAALVTVDPAHQAALEAVIRAWIDAVVVTDTRSGLDLLRQLEAQGTGAAGLLAVRVGDEQPPAPPQPAGPATPLLACVAFPEEVRPLMQRLLADTFLVESLDAVPDPVPARSVFVTTTGALVRGDGAMALRPQEAGKTDPLARRHMMAESERQLDELRRLLQQRRTELQARQEAGRAAARALEDARRALQEARQALDIHRGKAEVVAREAEQARSRLETVNWELENLQEQRGSADQEREDVVREKERVRQRRETIKADVHRLTADLRERERARSALFSEVLQHKGAFAEQQQRVAHLAQQAGPMETRIQELESLVDDRSAGLAGYEGTIRDLSQATREAEAQVGRLREETARYTAELDRVREERKQQTARLAASDDALAAQRATLDERRSTKSERDIARTEQSLRKQNLLDRVTSDYHVTPEDIDREPEPEWEGDRPDPETLETMAAEMRVKLEAMGPVNLVAIEEYQEREERYAFLTQQMDDLEKAKQQLLELIRKINATTSEMFIQTFNAVNDNFQGMFKQLFGGGSAKLVLANDEDVLESGVEIIARPPGKKLQSVSLLSGGERTLTAVALLFAIYMVRPSPFCVLDELDAALDDSNIGRFVKILEQFLKQSQFLIITHNRRTIAAADAIYGVTMQERGLSRIVSLRFSDYKEEPAAATPAPAPARG
ncbi:MAG: chromosome segregation protein SMC [Kiritimatiellae bacterium]|nr:chromosome segregation protein SMC [Kiritimatiellia bacterium]